MKIWTAFPLFFSEFSWNLKLKTCHLLHFMHWHVHKSVKRSNVLTGVKWLPRGFRWHALTSMQNRASQLSMYWPQWLYLISAIFCGMAKANSSLRTPLVISQVKSSIRFMSQMVFFNCSFVKNPGSSLPILSSFSWSTCVPTRTILNFGFCIIDKLLLINFSQYLSFL